MLAYLRAVGMFPVSNDVFHSSWRCVDSVVVQSVRITVSVPSEPGGGDDFISATAISVFFTYLDV